MRSRLARLALAAVLVGACSPSVRAGDVDNGGEGDGPTTVDSTAAASADPEVRVEADGTRRLLDEVPLMHPSIDGYGTGEVVLASPDGRLRWALPVRVADEPVETTHGLMEVPEIPFGTGMAFAFEEPRTSGFWMFQTLVPLDIAYVDRAGTVVTTYRMEPCSEDCTSYPDPAAPYTLALEVPAGFFEQIGLAAGWTIRLA